MIRARAPRKEPALDPILIIALIVAVGSTVGVVAGVRSLRHDRHEELAAGGGEEAAPDAPPEPAATGLSTEPAALGPAAAVGPQAGEPAPAPGGPGAATAELTVIGLGRADPGTSRYIAEIQRRLAAQGRVRYRMHAMGTELEGSTEDILALAGELHRVPFELGMPRVYTVLKLDERTDKPASLAGKVRSVTDRLDRSE